MPAWLEAMGEGLSLRRLFVPRMPLHLPPATLLTLHPVGHVGMHGGVGAGPRCHPGSSTKSGCRTTRPPRTTFSSSVARPGGRVMAGMDSARRALRASPISPARVNTPVHGGASAARWQLEAVEVWRCRGVFALVAAEEGKVVGSSARGRQGGLRLGLHSGDGT